MSNPTELPDLLSCPFCGNDEVHVQDSYLHGQGFMVMCGNCTGEGPLCDTEQNAATQWNRREARASATTAQQVKQALDDLCDEAHANGNTLTLVKRWRDTIESALASRPAEVDDWISVDDRLPPKYEEVIVWPHPTDYCMTAELWGENASGNPVWKYGEYVNQWGHENVEITWGPITHWRNKLPAPSHTTNKEK